MAQYAASAAQHRLSPISPVAASSASSAGGPPAPGPPSTATGPPSVTGSASQPPQPQHKRVYQACIPCRRRKVRCDLGSVDDPHDPPCVRCRRECKECYFSATRRKRKNEDDADDIEERGDRDDYIIRNGRKQVRTSDSPAAPSIDRRLYSEVPLTPGGSHGRSQPLRRPGEPPKSAGDGTSRNSTGGEFGGGEPNTPLENFEARSVMRREVYGPHDALDLLYKAATDKSVHFHRDVSQANGSRRTDVAGLNSTSIHRHDDHQAPSMGTSQTPVTRNRPDVSRHTSSQSHTQDVYGARTRSGREGTAEPAIDPELIKRDPSTEPGYNEALKVWTRFRFVKAGWFTAQEAIDYIE